MMFPCGAGTSTGCLGHDPCDTPLSDQATVELIAAADRTAGSLVAGAIARALEDARRSSVQG